MIASQTIVWFYFFGLLGWVFESLYCSFVEKRWCNRGFLYGPICPIYGLGAVSAIAVFGNPAVSAATPPAWAVFIICALGASAIEWFTSIGLERVFGTVWWDYSNLPLNIKGRVCVPAACLFGLGGLAIVYVALPLVKMITLATPPLAFEILGLALMALLTADTMLTVATLTEVVAMVEQAEAGLNERVQGAVDAGSAGVRAGAEKLREGTGRLRETGADAAGRIRDTRADAADLLRDGRAAAASRLIEGGSDAAERIRYIAGHMSARQQHVLHNARRFRTGRLSGTARRLEGAIDALLAARGKKGGQDE